MSNLKFVETHNLVAFLEKPKESDGFVGIIDFLNASSIRYTLTVNPTIYTSCINQLWATAKAKTVNEEVQIQALVDGKKVIVTETSVRRALQLKDVEGTECLLNAIIFEQLTLMGVKMLERRNKSRSLRLKRLRKVGRSAQVVSSKDEGLSAQEDASKQGRKITNLDADAETLIEIKVTKPKAVTTAATTTTTVVTRPKARGVVVQEPNSEVVKGGKEKDEGSVTRAEESSSKRAGTELEQERIKNQKIDDDQEEAEMKRHIEIVVDEEEIAVDAIPLATKPLIIID
ncbi:hypothetical protein Tco_0335609 [Tanacetum coccineum]